MTKWLSSGEIANLLDIHKRSVIRRAEREKWPRRTMHGNGGAHYRYHLAELPEDVQAAYAASLAVSVETLQNRLKPSESPVKKAALANHNARSGGGGEAGPLEQASADKRRTAALRAKVLKAWDESGLNAERFLAEYNSGRIAREVRAELGNKTICHATLYNWLGKYQHHDEAGLAPQYRGRGGNGASLDEATKSLIWFYYLHKNKPSIAQVMRRLHDKENIEASEHIVYRYIRYEIPGAVKDYFRRGKKYYHDHYEPYVSIDYTRYRPMQLVVYDHKTLDFASRVWRDGGWHRARLVLTAITDKRSRMILGWWIDEIPSTLTVIRATRMMVERYGCPDGVQLDNGKDFAGYWFSGNAWDEQRGRFGVKERRALSSVLDDLGCAAQFTEPYHGQSKHIERAFGFIAGEFDKSFESYLGSNTSDRHDESRLYVGSFDGAPARPVEELPTVEETRELFARFAEWFNMRWKHSGQGMDGRTPEAVFAEYRGARRDLPEGFAMYVWTRREIKTVQRNGVRHEGDWYYNPAMEAITGQEVELRVSIDDIGKAWVFNLAGEFLYEAASAFRDLGITAENVRQVKRLRKQAGKHLEKYQSALKEIRKDRKTMLEELRDGGKGKAPPDLLLVTRSGRGFPKARLIKRGESVAGLAEKALEGESLQVVNGEPLEVIRKRRLRLPTDPD